MLTELAYGASWGSRLFSLIKINEAPGYAGLFAFQLVKAFGEAGIRQGHDCERSNSRGFQLEGWEDGGVYSCECVRVCGCGSPVGYP